MIRPLIHRSLRHLIAQVLICALLLQALIPMGFMPGVARDGSVSLVLCQGSGPIGTPASAAGGSDGAGGDGNSSGHHDVCAFAAAAHVAPLVTPLTISVAASVGPSADVPIPARLPVAPRYRAQQPRGPPFIA